MRILSAKNITHIQDLLMEVSFEGPYKELELDIMAGNYDSAWRRTTELEGEEGVELKDLYFERIFILELENFEASRRLTLQNRVGHVNNTALRKKLKVALIEKAFAQGCLDVRWARTCFIPAKRERAWADVFCDAVDKLQAIKEVQDKEYMKSLETEILTAAENGGFVKAKTKLRIYISHKDADPFDRWAYIALRVMLLEGEMEKAKAFLDANVPKRLRAEYTLDAIFRVFDMAHKREYLKALEEVKEAHRDEQTHLVCIVIQKAIANGQDAATIKPCLEEGLIGGAKAAGLKLLEGAGDPKRENACDVAVLDTLNGAEGF